MWASLKIINRYYWKSLFGPGVCFLFSFLYCFLVTAIWDLFGAISPLSIFPTMMNLVVCVCGLYCIPLTINNLRTSVILKRLSSSSVSTSSFITSTVLYYYIMTFISYLWMWMWGLLFFSGGSYFDDYCKIFTTYMNFWCVWYSFSINFFLSFVIGMFVLVWTKRNYVLTVVSVILLLVSLILAGYIVPLNITHYRPLNNTYATPLFYFCYIDPLYYSSCLSLESLFNYGPNGFNLLGCTIFEPNVLFLCVATQMGGFNIIFDTTDKWLNLILPLFFIFMMGAFDIYYMRWNVR